MKKLLFLVLLCITAGQVFSQSVVKLRGDTIEILKNQGNGELAIRNSTRDTAGFLLNVGNGATQFHAPHRVNDSTIQIGPITIITQGPGSPPGTNGNDTIYIAAAVDTFYTVPIGTAAGMIQTQYTISGPNFSEIRHSNWGPGLWTIPHLAADSLAYIDIDSAALRAYLEIAAGGVIITADNGLQKNTATNIQIGGLLLHNSEIATGPYQLEISSDQVTSLVVTHENIDNGIIVPVMTVKRRGGSAPAPGYGESIDFDLLNSAGDSIVASSITTYWSTSTVGSEEAVVRVTGSTQGVPAQNFMDMAGTYAEGYGSVYGFISVLSQFGLLVHASYTAADFNSVGPFVMVIGQGNPANDIESNIVMTRGASGAGVAGLGARIEYRMANASSLQVGAGSIDNQWTTTPTAGSENSEFDFNTINGGTPLLGLRIHRGTFGSPSMATFANNAAAIAGGFDVGDFYYNGDDVKRVH